MRISKFMATLGATACALLSFPVQASTIRGWFDAVGIGMVDTAYGWICDESNPYQPPAGVLSVYVGGTHQGDYPLNGGNWGMTRSDVPEAGFCGGNANVGWAILSWFNYPMYVYYKHPDGTLQLLGGSPKTCTGPGWCY
jgi:hypothetical protein